MKTYGLEISPFQVERVKKTQALEGGRSGLIYHVTEIILFSVLILRSHILIKS